MRQGKSAGLPVRIAGLGWYLPTRRVTNSELERRIGIAPGWIARVSGVHERRYVDGETTVGMATAATRMALDAIQILGGNGYINDYPAGRLLRDAKLYEIGAGTSEIRRMLIGRELFAETR